MKQFWKIAGSVALWTALIAYLVWAGGERKLFKRDTPSRGVVVTVRDSAAFQAITPGMVRAWIDAEKLIPRNCAASEVPVEKIEALVRSRGFVEQVSTWMDMEGGLHIALTQRRPVVRFNTATGYNFYVTRDGWVLPLQAHAPLRLPIVTGDYTPPFAKGWVGKLPELQKNSPGEYLFLHKLLNFVGFISSDDFWSAETGQINIIGGSGGSQNRIYNPRVELVPRAGDHVVMLGSLDGYHAKLDKLTGFYRNGLRYEGWDKYRYIDLSYRGQVVCLPREERKKE